MPLWQALGLAVALGCDAFAVGLGVGARWHGSRQIFRLAFHFGLFQFFMPLLGWPLGRGALDLAKNWAPWLACLVLVFLGGRMMKEGFGGDSQNNAKRDPTKGVSLVALSLATSIDALGAGFSLGLVGGAVFWPAVVIGLTAGAMTLLAMSLARSLSRRLGRIMDLAGGVILMAIGLKMVLPF